MSFAYWLDLAVLSIKDPAAAARQLLDLQIPRNTLWMLLLLVTVCNTILFTISDLMAPVPGPLADLIGTPFMMLGIVAGGLILTILSIRICGRLVGGTGTFDKVMVLIVWLQVLRLIVQAAVLFLMMTIPYLSALLVIVAAFVWLYLLVHFVNEAHQFGSLGRSAVVLIVSLVIPAVGIAVFLTLFGVPLTGTI
ncbi:MAG: YIP1 family protein [Rhodobacteraceae bacterium]|nr:YIP1 family protein [Paracoccaceae bacterium]